MKAKTTANGVSLPPYRAHVQTMKCIGCGRVAHRAPGFEYTEPADVCEWHLDNQDVGYVVAMFTDIGFECADCWIDRRVY